MISLVEGAKRRRTPNEIALGILLASLTLVFLVVCVTLRPMSALAVGLAGQGSAVTVTALTALFVCLAPTTIGGLLSAIGIAGMDRLIRAGVIATSGRAVEAAGDVDVLLLDKTGTITLGNRQATAFLPVNGMDERNLAEIAQLASLADETPEGRSVVVLAKERFGIRGHDLRDLGATFAVHARPGLGMTFPAGHCAWARRRLKGLARESGELPENSRPAPRVAASGGTPLFGENGRRWACSG
jgi:K+-transporting ATPase ATPase B chain